MNTLRDVMHASSVDLETFLVSSGRHGREYVRLMTRGQLENAALREIQRPRRRRRVADL